MASEQRLPLLFRIPPGSEPVAYDNWRKIMDLARLVNHIDGQINAPQSGIAALGFKTKWNEHDTTAGYLSDKLVAGSNVTFTVAHEYGDAAMTISVHNPVTLATNSGLSLSTQVLAMGTPSDTTVASTNSVTSATHAHAIIGTKWQSGFVSRTDNTISLSTRTVTVAPTGANFVVYSNGTKYTKTSESKEIANTVGIHYVYFGADGVIAESTAGWDFLGAVIPICTVFWNGSIGAISDERHGATRDLRWHEWAHDTIGTRYESGLAQTYPTTSVDDKIQIEAGNIHDEDIDVAITQQKVCRNFYETANGVWTFANGTDNAGNDYPYIRNPSTGKVQYPKSDNSYTLTDAADAKYVVVWVYATTDAVRPIYLVTAAKTDAYANMTAARAATAPSTAGLLTPEMKLIYRWIFAGNGQYQEGVDYRTSTSLPGGGTPVTNALAVTFSPIGNISATNVQNAIYELDLEKEPVLGNPAGDGYALVSTAAGVRSWAAVTAAAIPNVPAGNISSVTVQNAIYELDLEKEPVFVYATSFPGSPVDKQVCVRTDLNGDLVTSSGATTFLGLTDTPSSYSGAGSHWVAVNSGSSALEFVDAPEPALGNPGVNGYVLSSTTAGIRSWVEMTGGSGGFDTNCKATMSGDQTISNMTWTKIVFNTASFDDNNEFNTGTYSWVCKTAGTYVFSCIISWVANATGLRGVGISEDGSRPTMDSFISTVETAGSLATTRTFLLGQIKCTVGQSISIWGYQSCGGNLDVDANGSYFCAFRVA